MATRLYFHNIISPVSPAYSSAWETVPGSTISRNYCSPAKQNSASNVEMSAGAWTSVAGVDCLVRQFIGPRLEAQTISGTVKGQFRWKENNLDADYCVALLLKIVSADGQTTRGTLLSSFPASLQSEFATTGTNRKSPPGGTALTDVVCQAGDRLVIELGFRLFNPHGLYRTGSCYLNDTHGTDLPEDETTTTDYASWLEFSQTLDFIDQISVTQVVAQVEHSVPGQIKVSQVMVQVEFTAGTELVAKATLSDLVLAQLAAQGVNITYRQFPLLPGGRLGQTQSGKRKFPVIV